MPRVRSSRVAEDRPLAQLVGQRIRRERVLQGLTQAALAGDRYSKSYISALENGQVKPSVAALGYIAARLGIRPEQLLAHDDRRWTRLEADLRLAAGDWQQAADVYESLLAGATGRVRAELLRGLAEAWARLDRGSEAVQAAAESVALFEARGQSVDAAWSRYWHAFGLYELEESARARQLLLGITEGIDAGRIQEPDLHVRALIALGMVESRDDEPEKALAHLDAAHGLAEELDDRRRATYLFSLALSYRELGDFEGAISLGTKALAMFKAANSELEVGSLENELALVYLSVGNLEQARQKAATSRAIFERLSNERWLAHVTETLAQIELAAGDNQAAIATAEEAQRLALATANHKAFVSALLTLGRAERAMGDSEASMAHLEEAAQFAREHSRRGQLQAVLGELAVALAAQGDLQRAFEISQEALVAGRTASRSI